MKERADRPKQTGKKPKKRAEPVRPESIQLQVHPSQVNGRKVGIYGAADWADIEELWRGL